MLPKRTLPNTTLHASAFCLGSSLWGVAPCRPELDRIFCAFLNAGGNFFDTAHCYAFWRDALGAAETVIGELVRTHARRSDVIIATKGGHPAGGPQYPRPDYFLAPEVIASDITDSLARLQMDAIDLYYLHRDDSRVPVSEIIDALNAEVRRGRIRYLGASNWSTSRIAAANAYAAAHHLQGFVASQPEWSLAQPNAPVPTTDPAQRYLTDLDRAWHQEHQVAVIPYSSTAQGYFATQGARAAKAYDNPISRARLARALQLAAELHATAHQIALAYLLSQPFPVIPILGTTDPAHFADALGAVPLALTSQQLHYLAGDPG